MSAPIYDAILIGCASVLNTHLAHMSAEGYTLHSISAGGGEEGGVWVVMEKPATAATTMRDELRAWREAVTVARLDALDALTDYRTEPWSAETMAAMRQSGRELLTALRALVAAGDAGKGGGA